MIFAYGGFEGATIPAGEMRNPRRTISVAVLGTLVGVTVFYMLIQYAALRIEPDLAGSDTPLAAAGGAMFTGGLVLMTIGAIISIFGTKSGVALTAPRNLYGLSNEAMLPALFSRVSPRFRTPTVAIWTTGIIVVVLAITGNLHPTPPVERRRPPLPVPDGLPLGGDPAPPRPARRTPLPPPTSA